MSDLAAVPSTVGRAPFRMRFEKRDGGLVLQLSGEIDTCVGDPLWEAIEGGLDQAERLLLDLSAVTFMDSTGVNTLARALRACEPESARLVVRNPPRLVSRLLEITGLEHLLTIERASDN